jgi:hypothetical protein
VKKDRVSGLRSVFSSVPNKPDLFNTVDKEVIMALDLQGTWVLTGDFTLDGKVSDPPDQTFTLEFGPEQNGEFHGHYTNISDPSHFVARVFSSIRGTAISIVQTNRGTEYYATFSSYLVLPGTNMIQGAWVDLEGRAGDFQLAR